MIEYNPWVDEVQDQIEPKPLCEVWLLCENAPTTTIAHPILGSVPACQRCADKYKALGG